MALYIGMLSGTSMDGIDVALVDVSTHTLIAGITVPYNTKLRTKLLQIQDAGLLPLAQANQLHIQLGQEFAIAVQQLLLQTQVATCDIAAIGSHGQTLVHATDANYPYTVQLGCGHVIAEMTGITVVADFRMRDIVLGGQGAPFAPLYHHALWGERRESMAIVNIGGIANVTFLDANGKLLSGYDTGPGNVLLDAWSRLHLDASFDHNGAWAASGKILPDLLAFLLTHQFLQRTPPKSACKSMFNLDILSNIDIAAYAPQDVQATLLQFTVETIAMALSIHHQDSPLQRILVCGGGVHNQTLMLALQANLAAIPVTSTTALDIDADFLEAMLFAWMADCHLRKQAIDCTQLTGASKPAILGVMYPV